MPNIELEQLLGFRDSDRAVRAYAYLTASFNVQRDVNDVLDCLLPFVSAVVNRGGGAYPVELQSLSDGLANFGLKIPIYAIQQMLSRLAQRGLLEWNAIARTYMPTRALAEKVDSSPTLSLSESFESLHSEIECFARNLGLDAPLSSSSWPDALIRFLRSEKARDALKTARIKDAIVSNPDDVETFVIARFIQETARLRPDIYSDIIKVFTGILIEDFISNIQETGSDGGYEDLNVFYDTSVLLRLLGTSGDLLRVATLEMHTTLQELHCRTFYFDRTATEVQNILDSLHSSYSRGQEIYGETADAILAQEINIGTIKDLAGTFRERLAEFGIFIFEYNFSSRQNEDIFQIDEGSFAAALKSDALKNDRAYSGQNADNDAHVLALILRLRRGRAARDIGKCRYLFISKNSMLRRVARRFVIDHDDKYDESSIPPIFTVNQITTIAWIAATKKLDEHKISRELLASCYAAIQPSEGWATEFARVFENFQTDNNDLVSARANSMLFLNTARMIARDESLNQPVVLKKLNFAQILRTAAQAEDAAAAKRQEEQERQNLEIKRAQDEMIGVAKQQADAQARADERAKLARATEAKTKVVADRLANIVLRFVQIFIFFLFALSLCNDIFEFWPAPTWQHWLFSIILGLLTLFSFLDVLGIKFVHGLLLRFHEGLSARFFGTLVGFSGAGLTNDAKNAEGISSRDHDALIEEEVKQAQRFEDSVSE